jgi:hypothetical protein
MIDEDEWRAALAELTEWDWARVDDRQTYADLMAADGTRL